MLHIHSRYDNSCHTSWCHCRWIWMHADVPKFSHDLSSALVGLWNNKCNLKRWSKFKSPSFYQAIYSKSFTQFTFRTSHAPTAENLSFVFSFFFFYSRNILCKQVKQKHHNNRIYYIFHFFCQPIFFFHTLPLPSTRHHSTP